MKKLLTLFLIALCSAAVSVVYAQEAETDTMVITVPEGMSVAVEEDTDDYGSRYSQSIADEFAEDDANDSALDFLGIPFFNTKRVLQLLIRFAFNLLVCWFIVHFFYYRKSKRKDYYITLILFNTTMFLLICMMQNMDMQIGLTLGLFAIFGMIRYRTETVPVREMTYLFVITGMAVINGFAMAVSYSELLVANLLFIIVIGAFELVQFRHSRCTKLVLYERIELIVPERRAELIADLTERTGLKIEAVEIGHIDFLRDVAFIKVTYEQINNEGDTIQTLTKEKDFVG